MENHTDFLIFAEFRLIVELYTGNIKFDDIINLKIRSSREEMYDPGFSVIMDFRAATMVGGSNEVQEYLKKIKSVYSIVGERYVAALASKPNEVVLLTLFELFNRELPINSKVFSTHLAGLNWLSTVNPSLKGCKGFAQTLNAILTKQERIASKMRL